MTQLNDAYTAYITAGAAVRTAKMKLAQCRNMAAECNANAKAADAELAVAEERFDQAVFNLNERVTGITNV